MTGVSSPLCLVAGVAESPVFDPEDTVNREIVHSLVKVMPSGFLKGMCIILTQNADIEYTDQYYEH